MRLPARNEISPERQFKGNERMVVANPHFYQTAVLHPLVLVVEADEDTRLMMKYLLQIWGYRVIEAARVEDALEMTEAQQPNAILFCGKTKEETDFAVRRMRELSPVAETVIIFISSFSEPPVRAAALNAGADDFLVKPIDFGQLEELLAENLKRKLARKGIF